MSVLGGRNTALNGLVGRGAKRAARGLNYRESMQIQNFMAGLAPAIPLRKALCPPKRDRRVKPGDDGWCVWRPALPASRRLPPCAPVQHFADAARELGLRDRLLQQLDAFVEPALMHHGVARIAGHVQHRKIGPQLLRAPAELAAVDPGHHHVGEHQIDAAVLLQQDGERALRVAGGQHAIVQTTQKLGQVAPQVGIVLDDKDGLATLGLGHKVLAPIVLGFVPDQAGEVHLDRRALADLAVDLDVPDCLTNP